MPRNMSFFITQQQFRNKTKTVTRRLGWDFLKPGDIVNGCEKCQGLKKGEKIKVLGKIRVKSITKECLCAIYSYPDDCKREGFPNMSANEFVDMFCEKMKCPPCTPVNRIEFEYYFEVASDDQQDKLIAQSEAETRVGSPIVDRTFEFAAPDPEVTVTLPNGETIRFFEAGLPDEVYIKRARYLETQQKGVSDEK